MQNRILIIVVLLCHFYAIRCMGQSVSFDWVSNSSGPYGEYGNGVVVDGDGNVYALGTFADTVDFDPSSNEAILISQGTNSTFILKFNPLGGLLWAKSLSGNLSVTGNALGIDDSNNLYIAGNYSDTADFDPGPGILNMVATGVNTAYLLKLDQNGDFIYAKSLFSDFSSSINAIEISNSGAIHVNGYFQGTIDLDPSTSDFNLTSSSSTDVFIAKYDPNCSFLWGNIVGGFGADYGYGVAVDSMDNLLWAGKVGGQGMIQKVDPFGNTLWSKTITGNATCMDVDIDTLNNIIACGFYSGNVDMDPGPDVIPFSTFSPSNGFVLKLNDQGDFIWANSIGGGGDDKYFSIQVDDENHLFLLGNYQASVDFNGSNVVQQLSSVSNSIDVFVQKLDSSGNFNWVKSLGGNNSDQGRALAIDLLGNVYLTGIFQGTADFDPSTSEYLISATNADVFVEKLGNCVPEVYTQNINSCGPFQWINGLTYSSNNSTDYFTILNGSSQGCDSIVYLDLTVITVDTSITQTDTYVFEANAANAAFQWINCSNDQPIFGEVNQSFSILSDGSYTVEVTQEGCVDTASCFPFLYWELEPSDISGSWSLYPNPTTGDVNIYFNDVQSSVKVNIYNPIGQLIRELSFQYSDQLDLFIDGEKGLYMIDIITSSKKSRLKLLKE